MGAILAVRVAPRTFTALSRELGPTNVSLERSVDPGELIERVTADPPLVEAVVIGSAVDRPWEIAQRLRTTRRDLALLLLSERTELARLKQTVHFSPFLGRDVRCCTEDDPDFVARAVCEALDYSRKRRSYRGMVSAAQARVHTLSRPLPRASHLLDRLLDRAPIGMVLIDPAGHVVDFNRRAHELLGGDSRQALLRRPAPELFAERAREEFGAMLASCSDADDARPPRVFADARPDGDSLYIEVRGAQVRGSGGNRFVMLILQDVSERERLAQERAQFTELLEQLVAERTRELEASKKALEQSNTELEQFAYVASHDLQTPLRSIAGFAQFLQRDYHGRLDARADDHIERIVGSAKRMRAMINDLLSYSRVESRTDPTHDVDLNSVFDDVATLLSNHIDENAAEVTRDDLPLVRGDRRQLRQLFQNLIANGLKYRGETPPRVHVSATLGETTCTIAVRDNGIGIDPKHHQRIFEIFRRLHTESEYPGTGIGLAVCRRIVQRHGGEIWVESERAHGSTFCFTMPMSQ